MKPVVAAVPVLVTAVAGPAIIWIVPVVGVENGACERYPYSSGCR